MKIRNLSLAGALLVAFAATPAAAQTISIGSNPQGSLFYALGTAISSVMSQQTDKQYRVAPYGGSSTYLPMVNRGELEFGLTNSGEAVFAYKGTEIFEGMENAKLRVVASLIPAINGWVVRTDSPYKTVADLKGARVPSEFTAGRTFHYLAGSALAASGLTWDDVRGVPAPEYVAGMEMLIENRVDAAYSTVGVAIAQRAMASIDGGIRFLPIDASGDVNERIQSVMPAAEMTQLRPSDANNGIVADPTHLIRMQFVLVASEDTDPDLVYELTRKLHESKPALVGALGAFKRFDPDAMARKLPVPFHEGAIRFYKEAGLLKD